MMLSKAHLSALVGALAIPTLACLAARSEAQDTAAKTGLQSTAPPTELVISYEVPTDTLDPNDLTKSAIFAWNQFIALTWPAAAQGPDTYPRETPDTSLSYGQTGSTGQVVWETFRHKLEIFPSIQNNGGTPPGFTTQAPNFGYDSAPVYNYTKPITALPGLQGPTTPFNNLDESTEISLNAIYAGVVTPRDAHSGTATDKDQKVLFQAKANRAVYQYAMEASIKDGLFSAFNRIPFVNNATANFKKDDPSQFAEPYTDLPMSKSEAPFAVGSIEIKAAFRRLGAHDDHSKYYTPPIRYYVEEDGEVHFIDSNNSKLPETWGLIALHIIHKTPNSPSFSYTTFGHINNILDKDGNDVEEPDGTTKAQYMALEPFDPALEITPSANGQPQKVVLKGQGEVNTNSSRLYYHNIGDPVIAKPDGSPYTDPVNINRRLFPIPPEITAVNAKAQSLIAGTVWANYRLVNVQARALDATRDKATIAKEEPTYFLANEVVESNANLQRFRGGLANSGVGGPPEFSGQTKGAALDKQNLYQLESGKLVRYNMGGCMGCHGSQGQSAGGDFSVIFARSLLNDKPETIDEDEAELSEALRKSGKYVK